MKYIIKSIVLICACVLIFSSGAVAEELYDFNSFAETGLPVGLHIEDLKSDPDRMVNLGLSSVLRGEGDTALKLSPDTNRIDVYYPPALVFEPSEYITENTVLEFDINFLSYSSGPSQVFGLNIRDNKGTYFDFRSLLFASDGMCGTNSKRSVNFEKETWYRVSVFLNFENKNYSVVLKNLETEEETTVVETTAFLSSNYGNGLKTMEFNVMNKSEILLDNLSVASYMPLPKVSEVGITKADGVYEKLSDAATITPEIKELTVKFTAGVDPQSATENIRLLCGERDVSYTVSVSDDGTEVKLGVDSLMSFSDYILYVDKALLSASGNPIEQEYTLSFDTLSRKFEILSPADQEMTYESIMAFGAVVPGDTAKVQFCIDDTLIQTFDASVYEVYECEYDISNLSYGNHKFKVYGSLRDGTVKTIESEFKIVKTAQTEIMSTDYEVWDGISAITGISLNAASADCKAELGVLDGNALKYTPGSAGSSSYFSFSLPVQNDVLVWEQDIILSEPGISFQMETKANSGTSFVHIGGNGQLHVWLIDKGKIGNLQLEANIAYHLKIYMDIKKDLWIAYIDGNEVNRGTIGYNSLDSFVRLMYTSSVPDGYIISDNEKMYSISSFAHIDGIGYKTSDGTEMKGDTVPYDAEAIYVYLSAPLNEENVSSQNISLKCDDTNIISKKIEYDASSNVIKFYPKNELPENALMKFALSSDVGYPDGVPMERDLEYSFRTKGEKLYIKSLSVKRDATALEHIWQTESGDRLSVFAELYNENFSYDADEAKLVIGIYKDKTLISITSKSVTIPSVGQSSVINADLPFEDWEDSIQIKCMLISDWMSRKSLIQPVVWN